MNAMPHSRWQARAQLPALPAAGGVPQEPGARKEPTWFNAPVPSFGPLDARVLIVGLAPGLQGANRTGRPFTGDYAGVLLYETLARYKFARGQYGAHPDDGLELHRLPHHQCGALRAAGEQADHRRDRDLPRFPQATIAEMPKLRAHRRARAASPTTAW